MIRSEIVDEVGVSMLALVVKLEITAALVNDAVEEKSSDMGKVAEASDEVASDAVGKSCLIVLEIAGVERVAAEFAEAVVDTVARLVVESSVEDVAEAAVELVVERHVDFIVSGTKYTIFLVCTLTISLGQSRQLEIL